VKVGLTSWIAATGRPFHARNFTELSAHCHHRGLYDGVNFEPGKECGALLGVPLQIGGTILGVIKVENTSEKGAVSDRDFLGDSWRRFEILAQDVSLAIMRLQSQIPARSRIIRKAEETILEISRGGLEIPELVSKVVKETRALFDAGACALFLKDGDRLVQYPWAADGWAKSGPDVRTYNLVLPDAIKENPAPHEKVGLTVWIAVTQKKFTARSNQELRMHPHHLGTYDQHNFKEGEGCHSFMGLPLLIKEEGGGHELVGVLKVESKKKKVGDVEDQTYFNELDELAFELIANSAAIAIQNARLAGAKARERAWQEFSGMTAHRIGTEAVNIRGALRRLRDALSVVPTIEHVAQNLTRIAESLKRLDGWVYEFGEFAHAPGLKLEWLNLNELCHKVESQFAAEGSEKVQVMLDLEPGLPSIWGDKEMLEYTFKELFQNALKAMPEGGQLTVTTRLFDGVVRVHFKDTGKGIDAAIRPRIFEAGFRGRPGGTGLGLAIVQRTIQEHRGTIREIGEPGCGAHFVIELSVAELERLASQQELRTILLVEDNPLVREDLEQIIGKDAPNRRVVPVPNEAEAIRLLDERPFDVVVTDVALDEGGGTATGGLDVLRAAQGKAPVIVVTAYSRRSITADGRPTTVAEEAKRLGCFALIPRPDPVKDYVEVLRDAVTDALRARAGTVSVSM
jgi:signal transduction histidine kinase